VGCPHAGGLLVDTRFGRGLVSGVGPSIGARGGGGVPTGAISSPDIVVLAHGLRACASALERALWVAAAVSLVAAGTGTPWLAAALCGLAAVALGLALRGEALRQRLRGRVGPQLVGFHASGRWLVVGPQERSGRRFTVDLARDRPPRPPLVLPGLALSACFALQRLPVPALVFLAAALLHVAASRAYDDRAAGRRLRRGMALLGVLLAGLAFAREGRLDTLLRPVFSRELFAAQMLACAPMAVGLGGLALLRYERRVGARANLRRRLVVLRDREGAALLRAGGVAGLCVSALVLEGSLGAIAALVGGLLVASAYARRGGAVAAAAGAVVLIAAGRWAGGSGALGRLVLDAGALLWPAHPMLGLALGCWPAAAALDAARRDSLVLATVVAGLLHEVFAVGFQTQAVAVLTGIVLFARADAMAPPA
jgi:hypothetical protein